MASINFRGKTYKSVFDMPTDVRKAYQREKGQTERKISNPLTDFVEMSDEVREMYERALGDVADKPLSSRPLKELPKTEDIYRRSAQANRSQIETPPPAIEIDDGPRRLVVTFFVLILLGGIAFLVMRFAL